MNEHWLVTLVLPKDVISSKNCIAWILQKIHQELFIITNIQMHKKPWNVGKLIPHI